MLPALGGADSRVIISCLGWGCKGLIDEGLRKGEGGQGF